MALIDQHKDVGRVINEPFGDPALIELVDQRGDDADLILEVRNEVLAGLCPLLAQATGIKGVPELLVQIVPIGNQKDARVGDVGLECQGASQHNHSQRLPRSLRLPDDATESVAVAVVVALLDPRYD